MNRLGLYCTLIIGLVTADMATAEQGLKGFFSEHFSIGVAVSEAQLHKLTPIQHSLLKTEFNSLTAENSMKWSKLNPAPGQYNFQSADQLLTLGRRYNANVIGHTLVWHQQVPEWVFRAGQSEASREQLLGRMKKYINTVMGRYQGEVLGWDVVNEALAEDGTLRQSPWARGIGDDFVIQAFKFAQAADPRAELYYNDYNLFKPQKRQGAIRLIKQLQAAGVRIDGIGMQGHYALDYPDLSDVEASIEAFTKLGIKVMITELDVSVLPFPSEAEVGADLGLNLSLNSRFNIFPAGLDEDTKERLAQRYQAIFNMLLEHKDNINRVTFWGLTDKDSWRNNWPMKGRRDYPLLFDRQGMRKAAYDAVVDFSVNGIAR